MRAAYFTATGGPEVAVLGDLLDARPISPTQAAATRPPAAIASPVPSNSGWTTYQDTDPRLLYGDGTWQTFPVTRANGGTLTGTADTGASLSIRFWGTAARVVYARGPEGGAFLARTKDRLSQTGDSYSTTYSYGHMLTFEGLDLGLHTLTLSDNDGALWIEAVEIRGRLLGAPQMFTLTTDASPVPQPAAAMMNSLASVPDLPESIVFVQSFEDDPLLEPNEIVADYDFDPYPMGCDNVGMAVALHCYPEPEPIRLTIDLTLGTDPEQAYRVTGFSLKAGATSGVTDPAILAIPNRITVTMSDLNGQVVYSEPLTTYTLPDLQSSGEPVGSRRFSAGRTRAHLGRSGGVALIVRRRGYNA